MYRFILCCLLIVLVGCNKVKLEADPGTPKSRITAVQRLNANIFADSWSPRTTVEIEDSVFHYHYPMGATLDDSVTIFEYYWGTSIKKKVVCDLDYIIRDAHTCLRQAYKKILENDPYPNYWRPLLWLNLDVIVKRRNMADTVFNYNYHFSSPEFY